MNKRGLQFGEAAVVALLGYGAWNDPGMRPWVAAGVGAAVCLGVVVQLARRRRRRAIQAKAEWSKMTPAQFEHAVADILRGNGWRRVKVSGKAGDRGADVIGTDPQGRRVVVQAKRYGSTNKVGSPEVQVLIGSQRIHKADRAMIVTSSSFTSAASELADEFGDIDLVDGVELARLARR